MQDDASTGITLPMMATLRDGRQVVLRGLQVEDKAALRAAFHRLSADSRYTRFMMSMSDLPEAMLEAATHPVPGREIALVAVSNASGAQRIVGGARCAGAPGSDTCEFAVTVGDDWHGLGLAKRLMATLIDAARAQGFRCMEGYVLASNTSMRRLAKRLGFTDVRCPDDAALRVVTLGLDAGGCGQPQP
jgi:RimJ/RimL family protein N-acetyltransferase